MATTTNFGWETPDDTDLVKDGALAIRTLGNSIDTSLVDLKGGTTGQVLSKTSNTDMDFTWVTSDDANAIQNAIVDAKGDLIAASAADTPARLAVGNNGETLVADSSASQGLRWQGNFAAGKNKIINGDFGIWQRGTSFSLTTADVYNADRWTQFTDANPTSASITRETFTAGTAPVAGYEGQYFHRTTITTRGSSTYYILAQRIEDCRTFANQTITVSFWARLNSGAVSTSRIRVSQNFGSGGSATVTTDNSYNFTPTATWTRFSLTIPVPSISGKTIGSGSYLQIDAVVPYSAANTVDFWGFQAEAGSVATPFQTATGTLAGELAACQRYYQRFTSDNVALLGFAIAQTAANAYGVINLKATMRATPTTLDISGLRLTDTNSGFTPTTAFAIYAAGSTKDFVSLSSLTFTGLTTARAYIFELSSSAGFVGFGAEL